MSGSVQAGSAGAVRGSDPPELGGEIRSPDHVVSRERTSEGERLAIRKRQEPVAHLRALVPLEQQAASTETLGRDAVFRRLLAGADVSVVAVALLVAQVLSGSSWHSFELYAGAGLLVVFLSKVLGLYDRDELVVGKTSLADAPKLFQLATLCTLFAVVLSGTIADEQLTATGTLLLWGSIFIGALIGRAIIRSLARALTSAERCLVLGGAEQAERLRQKFACHSSLHAEIVAYLPFGRFELQRSRPSNLAVYIAKRGIDRVIVGQGDSHDHVLKTVRYFSEHDLKVSVMPSLFEVIGSNVEFDEIHGTTLLGVRRFGLSRSSAILKRGFDLLGASLLLLTLAPLLIAIATAIKLDSSGPALFRQTRVGLDGARFTMLKFRTMLDGAATLREELLDRNQTHGLFKLADDPRLTRVGRILRSFSLDELPQLINVLTGSMSLVGPRPLVADEDVQVEGWQRRRLQIKPGMTGAWQILGRTRVPLREMVSMDYLYIVNWSLWSDVKILLQTAGHVLQRRGL